MLKFSGRGEGRGSKSAINLLSRSNLNRNRNLNNNVFINNRRTANSSLNKSTTNLTLNYFYRIRLIQKI